MRRDVCVCAQNVVRGITGIGDEHDGCTDTPLSLLVCAAGYNGTVVVLYVVVI